MYEPDQHYHPFYHHSPPVPYPYARHAGLLGIVGGVINLATTALYGGARIARTLIEGSVWHAEHPPYHHTHACHVCHIHCCPENHDCCGCC